MDKSFWIFRNPKQAIFCIMTVLMVIGCINVFSASYITAHDMNGSSYSFLWRYILFSVIGFIAMQVVRKIGYKRLLKPDWLFVIYFGVLILLMAVFAFASVKGARRWIFIPGFSLQPSEFAKLAIIMVCASSLGTVLRRKEEVRLFKGRTRKILWMTALYFLLILLEPDLGTAAIVAGLVLGMLIIAGLPKNEIIGMLGLAAAGAVTLTLSSAYRRERVMVMLDPWRDPMDKGYQMVQAQLAIGSGGLFGTHWGHGLSKFFYLPEAHTDFAFAVFSQENGFLGVALVLILFLLLGFIFTYITLHAKDQEGFLLAGGVTFLIIGQAVANIAMVGGLLPVIGVPLIFISYGGSSMVLSMMAIGLLLSVYDEAIKNDKQQLRQEAPERRRDDLQFTSSRRWQ